MKNVLRFWMERGAGGFRVGAVDYLFEFEDLRDEPVTGLTNDTNWYLYTHHHYTKDLVCIRIQYRVINIFFGL